MADKCSEGVGDTAVSEGHQREGRVPERLELSGSRFPDLGVLARAAEAGVEGHWDSSFLQPGPGRVVVGHSRRAVPVDGRYGTRHHHHDPSSHGKNPVDLGHGAVGVGQGDHGRGEQPTVPVESPVLVQPGIEGGKRRLKGRSVVLECLLHTNPEGGKEEGRLQALVVHYGKSGGWVPELWVLGDRVEVAEHGGQVQALSVAAPEVVLEAARAGDRVEGGIRDELVDPAAHQQALLSVHLCPLHAPLGHRGIDVPGESIFSFVVVVVGVEGTEVRSGHSTSVLPCPLRPEGWGRLRPHLVSPLVLAGAFTEDRRSLWNTSATRRTGRSG